MFQHAKLEFLIEDQRETLNLLGKSYRGPGLGFGLTCSSNPVSSEGKLIGSHPKINPSFAPCKNIRLTTVLRFHFNYSLTGPKIHLPIITST